MTQNSAMKGSEYLAERIQLNLDKRLDSINRGVKQAGFHVLVGATMPNVLVEVGFITNKKEAKQLSKAQYKREIAKGLFESVIDFKKINMKDDNRPIGVFDSGLGGLTVLRSLKETFPNESFIYFGDTARVPYGTKSQETIIRYSKEICDFLNKQDVKLIIVACNTVSALAVKF